MRAGLIDFGIAERPSCRCQRSITWAADLPCWRAISSSVGSSNVLLLPPRYDVIPPMGDQAWVSDALLRVEALQRRLLEVRMHFDLVHRGNDGRLGEQSPEMVRHEVADADRAHLPVFEQFFQGPVGVEGQVEATGQRLMQQQQVERSTPSFRAALSNACSAPS